MNIQPEIRTIGNKTLVGIQKTMSLTNNGTGELFRAFMPRRKDIFQRSDENTYDLRTYPPGYFQPFNPAAEFTRWALVEVNATGQIPEGMETFHLQGGLYAVFHYKGPNTDNSIFQYIFSTWLPASGYTLDDRPHFEVLGEKSKMNDPGSEEDIYIPVRLK